MKGTLTLLFFFSYLTVFGQMPPKNVLKLQKFYPQITDYKNGYLIFRDGTSLLYDDQKIKTFQVILDNPDIEDQFKFTYPNGTKKIVTNRNIDPGRIRNEPFFKKIYGESKSEVESKLVEITWCPILSNQKIQVTTVNGIDKIMLKLSAELDGHPEFKPYLKNVTGTFTWRNIANTNRLSMHSFGMTMDINVQKTNYWQWDCHCKDENTKLIYRNKIPLSMVRIFEKYGFIWGGKWYHYDTMHFEYRPELLF